MNNQFNQQKMIDAIVAQSGGKIKRDSLTGALQNRDLSGLLAALSPADRASLSAAMGDRARLREFLQSDRAKELLKTFLNGEKHG